MPPGNLQSSQKFSSALKICSFLFKLGHILRLYCQKAVAILVYAWGHGRQFWMPLMTFKSHFPYQNIFILLLNFGLGSMRFIQL